LHEREEEDARKTIEAEACEVIALSGAEHDAFAAAVAPLIAEAQATYGRAMFDLVRDAARGVTAPQLPSPLAGEGNSVPGVR
jgi:hypothetical protein